jgi:folate-dependent phosphoribosylglycinamide formyltransferase PurN
VADDDTAETLSQRILGIEHRIYPEALRLLAAASFASKATSARSPTAPSATAR